MSTMHTIKADVMNALAEALNAWFEAWPVQITLDAIDYDLGVAIDKGLKIQREYDAEEEEEEE